MASTIDTFFGFKDTPDIPKALEACEPTTSLVLIVNLSFW